MKQQLQIFAVVLMLTVYVATVIFIVNILCHMVKL